MAVATSDEVRERIRKAASPFSGEVGDYNQLLPLIELNVGQLFRERYGSQAVLIGFTTLTGTVTAASDWDGPAERNW